MIVKDLELPEIIHQLKALEGRTSVGNGLLEISSELARRLAGFKGEQSLMYYLHQLPEKEYFIFHNLRLQLGDFYFQMDFLILTTRFALILETKNIVGTLFFDSEFGQLIRLKDGEENGFQDPITQVRRQQEMLRKWISKHGGWLIPVEYFVVVSNPSSIIRTNPGKAHLFRQVIHGDKLPNRISNLSLKFTSEVLDQREVKKLSRLLLKAHKPQEFDVLGRFGLCEADIIRGVRCGSCGKLGMERRYGHWCCLSCGHKDADAHVTALKDYFYLVKQTITNKEFRKFTLLESPDVALRLLNKLNLTHTGKNKDRVYHAPAKIELL